MNTARTRAMNTYRSIGAETAVHDATTHGLVLLLFDGARVAIGDARAQMQLRQVAAKGRAIGKAIEIIDSGLKASLDMERGGRIAERLYSLYEYMIERLMLANLRDEPACLDEVGRLLAEIESAWREIGPPPAPRAPAQSDAPSGGSYARA